MQPKYMEIYYDIVSKMEQKKYPPNTKLPSEGAMVEEYGVSRDTVRKALALLLHNGFIQKSRGKAPIVLENQSLDFPVSSLTTFTELAEHTNMQYRTFVEQFELMTGNPDIMNKLQLEQTDAAFSIIRVREISGQRIIMDKDCLRQDLVPNLTEEIAQGSLYRYFEQELGLKIGYAKKEITVQTATSEDHRLLDMGNQTMIVVVKSKVFLEDTTLFQYSESRHRPDKFIFTDFARRKPKI